MPTSLVLAALLAAVPADAPDPLAASLNAPSAEYAIYLKLRDADPPQLLCARDTDSAENGFPVNPGLTIAAKEGVLNVRLEYLNPLAYGWAISEETSEDPTYVAAGKFLEAIGGLVALVTPTEGAPVGPSTVTALAPAQPGGLEARAPAAPESISVPEVYSPQLLPWAMWMASDEVRRCIPGNRAGLDGVLKVVGDADAALFGQRKGANVRSAATFDEQAAGALDALRRAANVAALEDAAGQADKAVAALKDANAAAAAALAAAAKAPERLELTPGGQCDGEFARNLERYTKIAVDAFSGDGKAVLERRSHVVTNLATVISGVTKLVKDAHRPKDGVAPGYFTLKAVDVPSGKVKDVTVVVRRRTISAGALEAAELAYDDKPDVSAAFRLVRHQSFLLQLAAGAAYTNLTYPRYGTAPGQGGGTVVASAGTDHLTYSIVAMLDLVPNFGLKGLVYPVFQVGIGTGKDYPLLLAGGGLRLLPPYDLSLTFGAAWTWVRVPKTLELGDPVEGTAQLESDLVYEFRTDPAFYVGIQRAF